MSKINCLKPQELVNELNKYIINQKEAKKAISVALRNRYRRKLVDKSLRDEIIPKNILMIGPTGVGKTEIAKRIAKLTDAPFVKVEATNFTEVGYVGKDVDTIIKDLVNISIKKERKIEKEKNRKIAKEKAKERIIKILSEPYDFENKENTEYTNIDEISKLLEEKKLDDKEIEIDVNESIKPVIEHIDVPEGSAHIGMINISEIIGRNFGFGRKKRKIKIKEALEIFTNEEEDRLLDEVKIINSAIQKVEEDGIVFIDEIDKISMRETTNLRNGNVSREGVQRDLLPLIEGTTIITKYGTVKTDHILFIASGAFHNSNISDLLPEFQGRFPIIVKLNQLTKNDFVKILEDSKNSLTKQYIALIATEDINLKFTKDGISEIATLACKMNEEIENIGARRLYTLIEKIIEDLSYEASDMKKGIKIKIDKKYVNEHIGDLSQKMDRNKFIL